MRAGSLFLLAVLALAAPLTAQDAPARIPEGAPPRGYAQFRTFTGRPALGVVVDTRGSATDSIGARVESVTPGGPAARAGIRSGDIITRFGGRSLTEHQVGVAPEIGSPALRLIELSAQLRPADTVAVQLRRGRQTRNVRVVTEPLRAMTLWRDGMPGDRAAVELQEKLRSALPLMEAPMEYETFSRAMFIASPLGSLQLAPLNDDLGQYFGTTSGILVINAPKASGLRLRGGDVVLRVDGRTPTSPIHLIRILSSYGDGEGFTLEIIRSRKRETVNGSLASGR